MASKSARKRRKRRPPPPAPKPTAEADADAHAVAGSGRHSPSAPGGELDEAPPAPWGSFPLVELAVLVGLIMLVLGFFFVEGNRGPILVATGLALGSIGGLELTIREHFSGFRSHTMMLAGVPALIVLGLLFYIAPGRACPRWRGPASGSPSSRSASSCSRGPSPLAPAASASSSARCAAGGAAGADDPAAARVSGPPPQAVNLVRVPSARGALYRRTLCLSSRAPARASR